MIYTLYNYLLVVSSVLLLFIGFYLLLRRIPLGLRRTVYQKSRRIVGVANIIWGLEFVFLLITDLRFEAPIIVKAANLTLFYLFALMFAYSMILFLWPKGRYTKRRLIVGLVSWVIYSIGLWTAVLLGDETTSLIALKVAVVLFYVFAIAQTMFFRSSYIATLKKADGYFVDNIEYMISWVKRGVYSFVFLGFLAWGVVFLPLWFVCFDLVCIVVVLIYIFARFISFMVVVDQILEFNKVEDYENMKETNRELETNINILAYESINKGIELWVENQKFKDVGVSIMSVSADLHTNRTYLSTYINTKYEVSFKEWVTAMRIDVAKEMLLSTQKHSISNIASEVGFNSLASFTRAFSRIEGISPLKWRERECKKILNM